MLSLLPLASLALLGCTPATAILGADAGPDEDTGSALLPDEGSDNIDDVIDDEDGDAGGGDDGPEDEPLTLKSGTWRAVAVSIEDDPCDWASVLDSFGITLLSLMPDTFKVNGEPDAFEIKALDYGAAGFITCEIGGAVFDCEEQSVSPLDFDLGEFGWEYGVTYFGEVESSKRIRGEAIVRYPSADDGTVYALREYGYELGDCTQTFYLELERVD